MSNAREEGFLFEMPDAKEAAALEDAYGAENTFRAMVIARLERIESLLKQIANRIG